MKPPLTQRELALLVSVFKRHPEIKEVRLFGSRAKGTHRRHSDIDLALWGDTDALHAESIAAELDELPLPYRYDVQSFNAITFRPLADHIERRGILIYSRAAGEPAQEFDPAACLKDLIEKRRDFWELARNVSHENLWTLIDLGLRQSEGSYRKVAEVFNIRKSEYHRLLDYLRRRECLLDFRSYRRART